MITPAEKLHELRERHKGEKIVFCSGSFDLTHAGHILFFEDCKKLGDILVVGVGSDKILKDLKGESRPVLNQHIRLKTISSLKPVDYCFLDEWSTKENPLLFLQHTLEALKPDVYVVNNDGFNLASREKILEKYPTKMVTCVRSCPPEFEQISTTKLIEKIKNTL